MSRLIQYLRLSPAGKLLASSALIFGMLILWLNSAVAGEKRAVTPDWEVVRSVPDGFGGTKHFVVIPEARQRDREYYKGIGDMLCKETPQCSANFWTDHNHIPQSVWMPVPDLAVMTASYERHPSYKEPVVHLACWLYPSRAIG